MSSMPRVSIARGALGESHRMFVVAALLMIVFGALYAWSVFIETFETELNVNRAAISSVFSIAVGAFALSTAIVPRFFKHLSPANWSILSCGLATVGLLIASVGTSLWQLQLGFGLLFGCSSGVAYCLALQLANQAMSDRRGLATGIVVSCYAMSAVVFAPIFRFGLAEIGAWPTLRVMAAGALVLGLCAFALLRTTTVRASLSAVELRALPPAPQTKVFWVLWFGFFFGAFAGLMVLGHAAVMVTAYADFAGAAVWGLVGVGLGNGIGRLLSGWLTDYLPSRLVLSASAAIGAVALGIFGFNPNAVTALAAVTFAGFSYGLLAAGFPAAVAHIYGTGRVAVVYGRLMTAWGVAGVTGPLLAGLLVDYFGTYDSAVLVAATFAMIAAATSTLVPNMRQ